MNAFHPGSAGAQALPLDVLLAAIPSLPRAMLNQLVDRAIDLMDADDGDPDLEDDDPAGGAAVDHGEVGTLPEDGSCHAYGDNDLKGDDEDYRLRVPHIARLRATRCDRTVKGWGEVTYRVRSEV